MSTRTVIALIVFAAMTVTVTAMARRTTGDTSTRVRPAMHGTVVPLPGAGSPRLGEAAVMVPAQATPKVLAGLRHNRCSPAPTPGGAR